MALARAERLPSPAAGILQLLRLVVRMAQTTGRLGELRARWREDGLRGDKLRRKLDSGDVVQEAMLQFLRYSPRFQVDNGNQFQGLLRRIVENVLRDQHDWYARKRRAMDRECPLPASSILYLGTSRSVTRPGEAAEQSEKEALVRLSLELLRDTDREIIILREYDGLPFPEISERLGIKESAVRMRLSRALSRLGKKMEELLQEDLS